MTSKANHSLKISPVDFTHDNMHLIWIADTETGDIVDIILQNPDLVPTPPATQKIVKQQRLSWFAAKHLSGLRSRNVAAHFDTDGLYISAEIVKE